MVFADWVIKVDSKRANPQPPFDPSGGLSTVVSVELTHIPTGVVYTRQFVESTPTDKVVAEQMQRLCNQYELGLTQRTTTPVVLDMEAILTPADRPPKPQEDQDLDAYNQAVLAVENKQALVQRLKSAVPAKATELDAEVAKLQAIADAKAAPVVDALTKGK